MRTKRESSSDAVVAGVPLTNPERVFWPERGLTKLALARYYESVAERMLPHARDRPLMLLRCPLGRNRSCFVQKRLESGGGPGVSSIEIPDADGGGGEGIAIRGVEGLVSLAQLGALEIHGWGAKTDRLERPDRVVLDLDPAPDLGFSDVVAAARDLRDALERLGLPAFPTTTGGKGIHLHVPLRRTHTWDRVKAFARGVAEALVAAEPERWVATASKAKRKGKVFVDWLRNARGATAILPYSPRAREGAPVATPLAWVEVTPRLDPSRFTLDAVTRRVRGDDPWSGYDAARARLPESGPSGAARRRPRGR
jgi:bifunctional non-homologous end joining protein LigD